jgi:hypothetical protein
MKRFLMWLNGRWTLGPHSVRANQLPAQVFGERLGSVRSDRSGLRVVPFAI